MFTKMSARGFQFLAVGLFMATASQPANTQSSALDPTFGTNGMVTANIASTPTGFSFEIATDDESDGSLDVTLGGEGIVTTSAGDNGPAPRHARAKAVAPQPDGKIVGAGGAPDDFLDADQRSVFTRRVCDWYDVGRWHH